MLLVPVTLAALGALVVHVETSRGVSAEVEAVLVDDLVAALKRASGSVVIRYDAKLCGAEDCSAQILAQTGAEGLIVARLFGVPSRIRIVVESVGPAGSKPLLEKDLPRDGASWGELLFEGLSSHFSSTKKSTVRAAPPDPERVVPRARSPGEEPKSAVTSAAIAPSVGESEAGPSLAPWIAGGAGLVALALGVGFGLSSRDARATAMEARPHADSEIDALESRAIGHGIVANVSFVVAGVAAVTAGVLFLTEE